MRVTPTQEQLSYLMSIGVSPRTISQSSRVDPSRPPPHPGGGSAVRIEETPTGLQLSPPQQRWKVLVSVLVFILLALLAARAAIGQDSMLPPMTTPSSPSAETKEKLQQPALKTDNRKPQGTQPHEGPPGGPGQAESPPSKNQRRSRATDDALATTLRAEFRGESETLRNEIMVTMADVEAKQAATEATAGLLGTRFAALAENLAHLSEKLESIAAREANLERTQQTLEHKAQTLAEVQPYVIWASVAGWIGIAVFLITSARVKSAVEKKLKQAETYVTEHLAEQKANLNEDARPLDTPTHPTSDPTEKVRQDIHEYKGGEKTEEVQPQPAPAADEPAPDTQMLKIVEETQRFKHLAVKPELPCGSWNLGLATVTGNVRDENQDHGLCFTVGGHQVLIFADGCGGVSYGQRAAYLAVGKAAMSIIRTYGKAPTWFTPDPVTVAATAMHDASRCLAVEGAKLNIVDLRGGLRTTLIIVVGNKEEFGYAYIGDGGGCVVHASGVIEHFLVPQKADKDIPNVLAASLGPAMQGEPVVGKMPRLPGDFLLVGTDGVFDRVDRSFPKNVLRGAIQHNGDLQKVLELILYELAELQDAAGYICDDNMTLGLMGDGLQPKLSAGFWATQSSSRCEQVPENTPAAKQMEKHPAASPQEVTL